MQGRSVADVCNQLGVKPHVLRYWEEQIPWLAPERSLGGHRVYSEANIHLLFRLKYLLERRGFTLQGAAEQLIQENTGEAVALKTRLQPLRFSLLELRRQIRQQQRQLEESLKDDVSMPPAPKPEIKPQSSASPVKNVALEKQLPGISGLEPAKQVEIMEAWKAFQPESRQALFDFLYNSAHLDECAAQIGIPADRSVQRLDIHAEAGVWIGTPLCSLLLLLPVFFGSGLADDAAQVLAALATDTHMYAVVLLPPESSNTAIHELSQLADHPRCIFRPMPVFPDMDAENRLLFAPGPAFSTYYPGPGVAIPAVMADESVLLHVPSLADGDTGIWYSPLGLDGFPFRLPHTSVVRWLEANRQNAAVFLCGKQVDEQQRLGPRAFFFCRSGKCPDIPTGLKDSCIVQKRVRTLKRLDKNDDIQIEEVRRVRASLTDMVQKSFDVSILSIE